MVHSDRLWIPYLTIQFLFLTNFYCSKNKENTIFSLGFLHLFLLILPRCGLKVHHCDRLQKPRRLIYCCCPNNA